MDRCQIEDVGQASSPAVSCRRMVTTVAMTGMTPNAELTGRRRVDALPARCRMGKRRLAGKVASRWRSG